MSEKCTVKLTKSEYERLKFIGRELSCKMAHEMIQNELAMQAKRKEDKRLK